MKNILNTWGTYNPEKEHQIETHKIESSMIKMCTDP